MIEIIIPKQFILFHSALIHCRTPSWYVESGVYYTNTRLFFSIVEQDYNIVNKVTEIIFFDQFCNIEKCSTGKNNKFGLVTNLYLLIDLRKSKYQNN